MSVIGSNILAGASGQGGGYTIDRSVRLRSSASAYLSRTPASTSNQKIWTFSCWMKRGTLGTNGMSLISAGTASNNGTSFYFSSDQLIINNIVSGGSQGAASTPAVLRDPSAWYHIVLSMDTTQTSFANGWAKIFINGVQQTLTQAAAPTQNSNTFMNLSTNAMWIARDIINANYFDGYLTEINFIDGQALTPSDFGETDAITGVWKAKKYVGTYGTNGFYLNFSDNSAATPAGLGKDYSGMTGTVIVGTSTSGSTTLAVVSLTGISVGNIVTGAGIPDNTYVVSTGALSVTLSQAATSSNTSTNYTFSGNNWTCNNISLTSGVTYDSMTDVPTLTSETAGNYCVLNPVQQSATGMSYANLRHTTTGTSSATGTISVTSGKWYWEVTVTTLTGIMSVGAMTQTYQAADNSWGASDVVSYRSNGDKYGGGSGPVSYGATYTTNDVIGVALDMDSGTIVFYKNNSSQGTAFSTWISGKTLRAFIGGNTTGGVLDINLGQRPFVYTPPTGFKALNTFNLPSGTITTSGSFTGNASTDGPFVYLNGVPTAMTINGNAVTFGTHADKTANGFKVRSSSSSYNASGSNTYSITTTGAKFKYANAQGNP